jgi:hypothetical protein
LMIFYYEHIKVESDRAFRSVFRPCSQEGAEGRAAPPHNSSGVAGELRNWNIVLLEHSLGTTASRGKPFSSLRLASL